MDFLNLIKKTFEKTSFHNAECKEIEKPLLRNGNLYVPPSFLKFAVEKAFRETAFFFRQSHLELLVQKHKDADPGSNERLVISMLIKNAVNASAGEFCLCQDSGAAIIYGWKSENIYTGPGERQALESGVSAAYKNNHLRTSIVVPSSFFDEYFPTEKLVRHNLTDQRIEGLHNTGNNLPAQIHIESVPPEETSPSYRLLFIAKGGGSSNKTSLYSMSKSLLEEKAFNNFLEEKIIALGTSACPPYRLTVVLGGISPEQNLEVQKLAAAELFDTAPYFGEDEASPSLIHRDRFWEKKCMEIGRKSGLGAQFGGTGFLLDARVLRLPRHAASCPVSIGVSCIAHRCLLARIDENGLAFEDLVHDPASFLEERSVSFETKKCVSTPITLDRPIKEILSELSLLKTGSLLLLSGKLLVARDAAHLKWHKLISAGRELPGYLFKYAIYYAGPSETPPGKIIGSIGPTTAERMDPYGEELMNYGASLITLAKGNRSPDWTAACKKHGGVYLGTVGGAAALLAEDHVTAGETIDYPELGMEAVRLITVKDLPAFVVVS